MVHNHTQCCRLPGYGCRRILRIVEHHHVIPFVYRYVRHIYQGVVEVDSQYRQGHGPDCEVSTLSQAGGETVGNPDVDDAHAS